MTSLITAIAVEGRKLLRSKIPPITLLVLLLVPFMAGFFMLILKDPGLARRLGFISTKAQIAGAADWSSYLGLLAQVIAVGGLVVFGFVISWVFGREYADRTIRDLLALPVARHMIVSAKFFAAGFWCFTASVYVFVLSVLVGNLISLPGWSVAVFLAGLQTFALSAILTILVSVPVAFFASAGRGYLPALGFAVFSLVVAQIAAAVGYGEFFPWSVPALVSGLAGDEFTVLAGGSIIIVLITAVIGWVATALWWRYGEQP